MYSGWDETVHCADLTIWWVGEKQMQILCKPKTLLTLNRGRKVIVAAEGPPEPAM